MSKIANEPVSERNNRNSSLANQVKAVRIQGAVKIVQIVPRVECLHQNLENRIPNHRYCNRSSRNNSQMSLLSSGGSGISDSDQDTIFSDDDEFYESSKNRGDSL